MKDKAMYTFDDNDHLVLTDKNIRMNKPLKNVEESVLLRQLLKDGMSLDDAKNYIEAVKREVKKNHELINEENKKIKRTYKKSSRQKFKEAFSKLTAPTKSKK